RLPRAVKGRASQTGARERPPHQLGVGRGSGGAVSPPDGREGGRTRDRCWPLGLYPGGGPPTPRRVRSRSPLAVFHVFAIRLSVAGQPRACIQPRPTGRVSAPDHG